MIFVISLAESFALKLDKTICPEISIFLFKLANKILLLYFLVLVLWFYLVLYVFNCPKSIGCTERCYQIVIMIVLSIIFSLKRLKQLLAIHLTLQQSVLE